jgi:maleamate amidohydrolase
MRVWDQYLSQRDRVHNAFWEKKEPFGFGDKPILLVIDNSYGVLGPRLPLVEAAPFWPQSCGLEGWEAIDKTVDLIAAARANGIPVVYPMRHQNFPGSGIARGRSPGSRPGIETVPAEYAHLVARQNEIVDEIAPQPGDLVFPKTAASVFFGTAISYYMTEIGADTVICCGNSTSGCVRATVVDACSARLRVGLVEDCTFDRTEASHAMSLFDMHAKYADIVNLEETIAYFESVKVRELVGASA